MNTMNTAIREIVVATDQPALATRKPKGADRGSGLCDVSRNKWLIHTKLPVNWRVSGTTLKTVIRRRTVPDITVVETKQCLQYLRDIAVSLAAKQRASEEAGFVVFFCGHGMQHKITDRMQLLRPFPEPMKVEIVWNIEQMQSTIKQVVAKYEVLQTRSSFPTSRPSPLDEVQEIVKATQDLREANGNLSVRKVADLFYLSLRELAQLLGRTPQALSKTPDADSLQDALGYFERIARLRSVLADDNTFRKWLRITNPALGGRTPLMILREKKWQELADLVDDILTGSPG